MTADAEFHRVATSGERIGLGVVGCGNITEFQHLPAIISGVPAIEVRALCNRSRPRLDLLGDRYRVPPQDRYTDYRNLLSRADIHAILVAVSPSVNAEIVPEAARAGKHVFVEKPMADTSSDARNMVESVERAGVKLQVGFNKRYYYAYRTATELVRAGRVGVPTGLVARFWFSPSRRPIPPLEQVISQNGIHVLDLVQFLLGPAREVFAQHLEREGRTTVAATVTFDSGAVGSVVLSSFGSWAYPNERLDIVGSNGCCLSAENGRRLVLFVDGEPALRFEETISAHWLGGHDEAGFTPQLKAFAHSIRSGGPTHAGPHDGLRSVLLAEAFKKSIATRQPVVVERV